MKVSIIEKARVGLFALFS